MSFEREHTDISDTALLAAEDRFSFREQIGRAESEARAQVAERVLWGAAFLNIALFVLIFAAMMIDQSNIAKGFYSYQMVTDKLLSVLIAGIVAEVTALAFCFGRLPFIKPKAAKR